MKFIWSPSQKENDKGDNILFSQILSRFTFFFIVLLLELKQNMNKGFKNTNKSSYTTTLYLTRLARGGTMLVFLQCFKKNKKMQSSITSWNSIESPSYIEIQTSQVESSLFLQVSELPLFPTRSIFKTSWRTSASLIWR